MGNWTDYVWIVVVSSLAAFFTAFGIGANDVANAFGSSVAARTLTMRQALLIASVCEFGGSVLLGAEVTRTVAGGIARISHFDTEPEIYMYGMLCALVASGTWLLLATYLSLPVSTTHATIGGVLGFAFVYGGSDAVTWLEPQEEFPYMGGLVPIILAWFTSPLLSGLAAAILFVIVRSAILRRARSLELAIWSLPVLVLVTVFINLFFVLYTGAEARLAWRSDKCAWIAAVVAGGCTLLTGLVGVPYIRHRVNAAAVARSQQSLSRQELAAARPSLPSAPTTGTLPRVSTAPTNPGAAGGGGPPSGSPAPAARGPSAAALFVRGSGARASRSLTRSTATRVSEGTRSQPSRQGSGALEMGFNGQQALPECIPEGTVASVIDGSGAAPSPTQTETALRTGSHRSSSRRNEGQQLPSLEPEQRQQQRQEGQGLPPQEEEEAPALSELAVQAQVLTGLRPLQEDPQQQPQAAEPHDRDLVPLDATGGGGGGGGGGSAISATAVEPHNPAVTGQQPVAQQQLQQQLQQQQELLLRYQQGQQGQQGQLPGWWQHGQEQQHTGEHAFLQQQPPPHHHQQQQQAHLSLYLGGVWQQQGQQQPQLQPQQLLTAQQQQYWSRQYSEQQQGMHWQQQQQQQIGTWQQQQQQQQHQQPQHMQQQAAERGYLHGSRLAAQQQQEQQQQRQQHQQMLLLQQQQQQTWNVQAQQMWQAQGHQQLLQQQAWPGQGQYQQQPVWHQQAQNAGLLQQGQDPRRGNHVNTHLEGDVAGHVGPGARAGGGTGQAGPVAEGVEGEWQRERGRSFVDQRRGGSAAAAAPQWQNAPAGAVEPGSETSGSTEDEPPRRQQTTPQQQQQQQQQQDHTSNHAQYQKTFDQLKAIVLHGTNVNVHDCVELGHDPVAVAIHAHAEVFDPATEHAFKYLQVVTAICDSFSHGANDVANSVGPVAAIWYIYRHQRVDVDSTVPLWVLVLGGAGIVVGLATYGYNIIRAIGLRLSAVTPSRGFCIELSTALVVVLASKYGLPISTTHCQVGATAGMGLLEGSAGLNWRLAAQFFCGWLVTLLFTALLSAGLFAAGAYAPSIQQARAITTYQSQLAALATQLDLLLNRTNAAALNDPATWGNHSDPLAAQLLADMGALHLATTPGSNEATRPVQYQPAAVVMEFFTRTIEMYVNNTLPYIGGMHARGQALPRRP